ELAELEPRPLHHREDLQSRDQAVAGRRAVETEHVTRRLAAQYAAALLEQLQHVAVADLRAQELDAARAQRELEPEVRHHRADDRAAQRPRFEPVAREHIEELIAVDEVTALIDHQDAVAVAVERETHMRAHARDGELQQIGPRRSAAL